ncbi:expressed unknown protein [Seminavis robusta]|uniref:Uncharacterized protein n=1 Tax=Seminavis robusta TaxID=568900 RepID=A0A9N8H1I8_9STRA|nr:expressed unknown protein [Seminavis robusta]|eukprot:Sro18_g012720.1 n/a (86) ;mRNA; r:25673-25991
MVKYSKSREGRVFGFGVTHIPTKKSESSKRSVAAANAMKVELERPPAKKHHLPTVTTNQPTKMSPPSGSAGGRLCHFILLSFLLE